MIGRHSDVLLSPAVERRVIRVRRHWAFLIKALLQTVGFVILMFLLSRLTDGGGEGFWLLQSLLWYAAVAAVLRFAWKVLEWWLEVVIVTDKRFMITNGIIQTKISMMPISKVTDLSFLRTVVGQVLGYGTLRVESAGQVQDLERIPFLPAPDEVFMAISELIFDKESKDRKQKQALAVERLRKTRRRRWPLVRWSGRP